MALALDCHMLLLTMMLRSSCLVGFLVVVLAIIAGLAGATHCVDAHPPQHPEDPAAAATTTNAHANSDACLATLHPRDAAPDTATMAAAALQSWVPVAPDSDFPIQNLPWGIFSTPANVRCWHAAW